jgi:hypothetical protein
MGVTKIAASVCSNRKMWIASVVVSVVTTIQDITQKFLILCDLIQLLESAIVEEYLN